MRSAPRSTTILVIPVILAATLFAAGCGSDSSSETKPRANEPKQPDTRELVRQDFSDATSTEWILGDSGKLVDDALVLRAGPGEVAHSGAIKDIEVDDVHVTVSGSSDDIKDDDATWGVLCRWVFDADGDSKDYYSFTVAPNGYAAIGTSDDILWQAREPIEQLNSGRDVANEVRAECIDDKLSLFVNDELVKSVTDDTIARGDVGLVLENYAKKGTFTAQLDDFVAVQVLDSGNDSK